MSEDPETRGAEAVVCLLHSIAQVLGSMSERLDALEERLTRIEAALAARPADEDDWWKKGNDDV